MSLSVTPDSGWNFAGWSGDLSGNENPKSITMDGNKSVTAAFSIIAQDGAATSATATPTSSSISFSHTTGTGENRLMMVGVSWNCGSTDTTILSAEFTPSGGEAADLDPVFTQQYYWTGSPAADIIATLLIYSLVNPPSGVTGTVNITFSGAVSNGIIAGAANFKGVDQTTPLGTANGATGTGTSAPASSPNVTLTGLDGDEVVFDSVFIGVSSASHTLAADAGQSVLWNISGNGTSSFNARGAASTEQAISGSVTMSWTPGSYGSTATRWAIAAVPINPASITPVNQAPVVSGIPDQTINEGESFTTINLDDYVSDVDNTDAEIVWSYSGNSQLTVDITNRVATVTIPDADWNGSETIILGY